MEAPFYSLLSFQRYNLLGRHAFVALMAIAVRSMQLTWRGFEQDGLAKYIEGNAYVLDELHELIQRMHDRENCSANQNQCLLRQKIKSITFCRTLNSNSCLRLPMNTKQFLSMGPCKANKQPPAYSRPNPGINIPARPKI